MTSSGNGVQEIVVSSSAIHYPNWSLPELVITRTGPPFWQCGEELEPRSESGRVSLFQRTSPSVSAPRNGSWRMKFLTGKVSRLLYILSLLFRKLAVLKLASTPGFQNS